MGARDVSRETRGDSPPQAQEWPDAGAVNAGALARNVGEIDPGGQRSERADGSSVPPSRENVVQSHRGRSSGIARPTRSHTLTSARRGRDDASNRVSRTAGSFVPG